MERHIPSFEIWPPPAQVFGGLIVGMVVKYADNILKNFANALSVILTVVGAAPLFGQYPSPWFIVGAAAVTLSVYMYSQASLAVRWGALAYSLGVLGWALCRDPARAVWSLWP